MNLRILGTAPGLALMPPTPSGWEVWAVNNRRGYRKHLPRIIYDSEWTCWFNLHSRKHMDLTYPGDVIWYKEQTKPIYFQKHQVDIPASREFPRKDIQRYFPTDGHYMTCSAAWLLAFAIYKRHFEKIELWGIEVATSKPRFMWERPCVFYWVKKAQAAGIDIWWPEYVKWDLSEAGDPKTYDGPLYGYQTKPEE